MVFYQLLRIARIIDKTNISKLETQCLWIYMFDSLEEKKNCIVNDLGIMWEIPTWDVI